MSESYMGARVHYCGHDGWFFADIHLVAGANVVVASREVTPRNLTRPAEDCTHHLSDFPSGGIWRPHQGIFIVPEEQVRTLTNGNNEET